MKLYKYFHPDRADVLKNGVIRFSPPTVLNDPFELKPHISELFTKDFVRSNFKENLSDTLTNFYTEFSNETKQKFSLESLLMIAKNDPSRVIKFFYDYENKARLICQNKMEDVFGRMIGILCLTETPNNLLMWAHYADSHQGFAIEFNSSNIFFDRRKTEEDDFRHLRKVIYSKERPNIVLSELDTFAPFLTKGLEWSYESEWRIMDHLETASKIIGEGPSAIHLFEFPKSAIKRVIFGCKISESKKDEILKIIESSKNYQQIACVQAQIHESKFELTFS